MNVDQFLAGDHPPSQARAKAAKRVHMLGPGATWLLHAVAALGGQSRLPQARLSEVVLQPDLELFLFADRDWFADAGQPEINWGFAGRSRDELKAATRENLTETRRLRWAYGVRDSFLFKVEIEMTRRNYSRGSRQTNVQCGGKRSWALANLMSDR